MTGDGRTRRRQVALFLLALLLLNAPLLAAVDRLALPSGAPLTPFFVFGAWFLLIVLGALNARSGRRRP